MKETNKTIQDLRTETEFIKKTQDEGLYIQTETTEVSFTNKIQAVEEKNLRYRRYDRRNGYKEKLHLKIS